jgi:hypothetical protein
MFGRTDPATFRALGSRERSGEPAGLIAGGRRMYEIAGVFLYDCASYVLVHLPWLSIGFYLVLVFPWTASLARGWASSLEPWFSRLRNLRKQRMLARLKPLDPQDLIDGATRCEMAGDWAQAAVLFRLAQELLKGTPDETYVANCIRRIEEKWERVHGD